MPAYDNCADCKGYGYFRCIACTCKSCEAGGMVKCIHCKNGKVPCRSCGATGFIDTKGLIFTRSEVCPDCRRSKTVACSVCTASQSMTCTSCKGSGRNAQCSKCSGTQKVTCHTCNGSGKVVSQWAKSLNDFPVDRLRFEHEKRQREISNLQMQISRVQRQVDQLQQDWNDAYEKAASGGSRGIHNFDAGGYQSGQQAYYDEIGNMHGRISECESEMQAIEQALNSKWK